MVQLSAAYARCHGTNCDIKGSCLRFLALSYKGPQAPAQSFIAPDPKDCALYLEVRRDENIKVEVWKK